VGCAAWNGHKDLMEYCARKLGNSSFEFEAIEELDKFSKNPGHFKKEFA